MTVPHHASAAAPDQPPDASVRPPAGVGLVALVATVLAVAIAWPSVIELLGLPVSGLAMKVTGSLTQTVLAGTAATLLIRATWRLAGRERFAWRALATGLALFAAANLGWTASIGAEAARTPWIWDTLFLLSQIVLLVGLVALPPSTNRSAPVRQIDTAIVMVGVACLLWVLPISSMLRTLEGTDATHGTLVQSSFTFYAAINMLLLVVAFGALTRCRPDRRGEILPIAAATLFSGVADLTLAISPTAGYPALARLADGCYLAGLTIVIVTARRLAGPEIVRPRPASTEVTLRRPAIAELVTGLALAGLALHQLVWRDASLVSILLGSLLVLLAIARLGQLEFEQRALTRSLRATAEDLYREARSDALTGTGNRLGLEDRLADALAELELQPQRIGISLFFIDIDHFKRINDGLGHHVGDQMLIGVAQRLTDVLGGDVYRVGGDEFVAVRTDLGPVGAEAAATATVAAFEYPFVFDGLELGITTSVGLARSEPRAVRSGDDTADGTDTTDAEVRTADSADALLRRADLALYRAKELGRRCWAGYEPALQLRADERLDMRQDIEQALGRDELALRYEPVAELITGRTVGYVARLEWRSPRYGVLQPEMFMPAAIEGGLLQQVNYALYTEVLLTLRDIRASDEPDLWLGVDLDQREITHPELRTVLRLVLDGAGAPPGSLHLRVGEDTIVHDAALAAMHELADEGTPLTVTGFGTGPSSLVRLAQYPASTIEVDSSFVDGLGRRRDDTIIVNAVAALTADLGLRLAASGISEPFQVRMLSEIGCADGTGRHVGASVDRAELVRRLAREPQAGPVGR